VLIRRTAARTAAKRAANGRPTLHKRERDGAVGRPGEELGWVLQDGASPLDFTANQGTSVALARGFAWQGGSVCVRASGDLKCRSVLHVRGSVNATASARS